MRSAMSQNNKPTRSRNEAILRASDHIGRRPPKEHQLSATRAEWRDSHWRVWLFDGWVDLDDELNPIGSSEEFDSAR